MSEATQRLHSVRNTPVVIRGALGRRDGSTALVVSAFGYLLLYLWAIDDLAFRSGADTGVLVVDQPFTRMFEQGPGAVSFEPIMLIEFGIGTYLFSPGNVLIGLLIATLVGSNLMLSYLAITQPKSCGIGASSGIVASIPALLAGSACCAPVILIVLGITASGTLLAVLPWLLPLGIFLLVVSLVYLAGRIDTGVFLQPE